MTENLKLCNFVAKYLGTVRFDNDQFAPILGYRHLVQGNATIKRIYYIECLNHNLFFVGQFCDVDMEVAFRKSTRFIRDLQGNDLLMGTRGSDLYTIPLQDSSSPTLICLLKLKFVKDQLCSFCEMGKAKRSSSKSLTITRSKKRLDLLRMDLCDPMQIETINGKKYILVIVDEYTRTLFLRSKDETLENGVVERRNRILVEAARTMLSASKLPLFFWAEAIATAFIDGENLVKMKEKEDPCIFVEYSIASKGYRVYNKRTRLIVESIHLNFDKIKEMTSSLGNHDHNNEPSSSKLIPNVSPSADTNAPSLQELDFLSSPLFEEYFSAGNQKLKTPTTTVHAEENNTNQAADVQFVSYEFFNPLYTEEGIDFEESFAPVARLEAVWIFVAYAAHKSFPIYQMDVKMAILNDFQTVPQQYPCCDDCGVTHDAYQCQPMNEVYYYEKNSCYDSTSIGFDQSQPQQYTVDHPIFNAHNDYLNSQIQLNSTLAKIKDQMTLITSLCEMACQVVQKKPEEKQLEEERAAKAKYWKLSEPDNSLSMGNEHLDTIPATKSDELIKSGVQDLIPIPSESEGIPDHMCDVPFHDNSPPLDVSKYQIEDFSESNEEFSSTDDGSFSFDNIDYDEVSPPDSELVSSEVMEIVIPEVGGIKASNDNPIPFYDLIISGTPPNLTPSGESDFFLEVDAFLAVEDEPTSSQFPKSYLDSEGDMLLFKAFLNDDHSSDFKTKSSSTSLKSLLEETNNFNNSLPEFTTFSKVLFDAEYESDSSDDQSCSDEDILEKIVSKPLCEEEITPMESLRTHDSSLPISSKIDSLLDEFAGELTLLKSIPPGIDEADCDLEEDIRLIEKLLYDNSSSRPPEEFVSANSDAKVKSFSPSPILVKDSDSLIEEIDLFCTLDYPMSSGIEDKDYDSERDILISKDLPRNNTLSFAEKESFHFDIPPFSRPPAKPPDGDTRILNIKIMGDISDQKAFMHKLMITLLHIRRNLLIFYLIGVELSRNSILTVIQNGNILKRTRRDCDGRVIILPPRTADEHITVQRESKARTTLLQFIPDDYVTDFHYMDDARDIWNGVKARFDGNAESKKMRKSMLKQEFLESRIGEAEGLHKGYDRMQKILSQLNQLKAKPEDEDINLKFLRALPSSWSQVALTLKTKGPSHSAFVSTTSASKKMPYGDSPSYSSTTTYSAPSNSKTGSHGSGNVIENVLQSFVADTEPERQLAYEDFEHIEKLDLEEMDLKWQMAMLSVRCYKCQQRGHFARECRAKGGNDKWRYSSFKIKEIEKKEKDSKALITVDTLVYWTDHDGKSDGVIASKEFEEASTAGDAREFALMGVTFERTSSKNMFRLINSSMYVRTKVGLRFNNYIRENELGWDDSAFSVFTTNSEDMEGRPIFNRFAKTNSMKVVHPPLSGDYTSLSNHIDLDESHMFYGIKSPTSSDSKSVSNDFIFCDNSDKSSEVNTNDFAYSDSNVKSLEPKPNDSTSYASTSSVSTYENEAEIESNVGTPIHEPIIVQDLPSFSCNSSDKNANASRTSCNKNGYFNKKAGHFRKHASSVSKLCFVYGSGTHLIKNCDFYEKQMVNQTVSIRVRLVHRRNKENPFPDAEDEGSLIVVVLEICDKKNRVLFKDTECLVLSKDFKLPDDSMVVLRVPRKHNLYTINLNNLCPREYKDETYPILKDFINLVENQLNKKVKAMRCDNGTEFKNAHIIEFCGSKGIKREYSNARTSQQMSHFKPFGCYVTILNTSDHLGKFDGKADEGYIVGYSASNKAYMGLGHEWYFNLDYLTDTLGYTHDKSNQSAGTKEATTNPAGTEPKDTSGDEVDDSPFNSADKIFQKELARLRASAKLVHPGGIPVPTGSIPVPSGDTMVSTDDVPVHTSSPTNLFFDDEPTTRFPSPSDLGNHDPSLGISSSSSYDDEFGAALKNVASTVAVSLVATKRINTIHPQSLIIEDHTLAVKTRSKRRPLKIQAGLMLYRKKCNSSSFKMYGFLLICLKARLIAQGHRQEEGIDYDEVFAFVARIEAIRLFLAFASYMVFMVYHIDVKSEFLYGRIDEEVYVTQSKGFVDPQHPKKVYKVVKALYGLHQAPRDWYATLSTFLLKHGYKRGTIDKTLFLKKNKKDIIMVQVYVDDIIFGSTKKAWCDEFKALMKGEFQMSAMGELTFFLGLQVQQRPDGMFISQAKYVQEILNKFDLGSVRTKTTPYEAPKPKSKNEFNSLVNVHLYRSMIVKKIFKYLKGQPNLGLWYPRELLFVLEAYSDSDYAGANKDIKSTIGRCQFLGRKLISWQCKKQTIMATSSTEAEYVAAANCCGQPDGSRGWISDFQVLYMDQDLVRSQLQLADDGGIDDLPIAKIYSGMDNLSMVKVQTQILLPSHDLMRLMMDLSPMWKILGGSFHMSLPRSTQAPPAGQTSGGAEDLITLTALSIVVFTLVQKVHYLETELKDHKKLFKDVVGKLVKKVKAIEVRLRTSKRKMVVSDSDQEEGGKQDVDLDALLALANAAVTVDSNISPGGASDNPAASISVPADVPIGASNVPTGSTSVPADAPTGVAPAGVSNKGKAPMAAKRLHDEEQAQVDRQRVELQRRRQQEVLDSAMYYNEADWIHIMAQVKANASLSKTLLGDDVSEDNFPARMDALIKRKKQALAEKLAKEIKDRPMTQRQQRTYMRQLSKIRVVLSILLDGIQAFSKTLKRTCTVLEEPSSKRQKSTKALIPSVPKVPQSPVVSSPQSSGIKRKSLGKNRLTKPKFKLQELDLDADDQTFIKVVSDEDSEDEAPRLWSALVGWEVITTPLGDINALYRIDRSTTYFTTLREILYMVDRHDLVKLYGLVVKYYENYLVAGAGLIL
nr:putative ribonuclease H-like domain-containing protein [Tanacetum cinerariifolium]